MEKNSKLNHKQAEKENNKDYRWDRGIKNKKIEKNQWN